MDDQAALKNKTYLSQMFENRLDKKEDFFAYHEI